jgi:hypothetical protein
MAASATQSPLPDVSLAASLCLIPGACKREILLLGIVGADAWLISLASGSFFQARSSKAKVLASSCKSLTQPVSSAHHWPDDNITYLPLSEFQDPASGVLFVTNYRVLFHPVCALASLALISLDRL